MPGVGKCGLGDSGKFSAVGGSDGKKVQPTTKERGRKQPSRLQPAADGKKVSATTKERRRRQKEPEVGMNLELEVGMHLA